jgi:hypothetical protein
MVEQWLTKPYLQATSKSLEELTEICREARRKQTSKTPKGSGRSRGSFKRIKVVSREEQIKALEDLIPMIRKANPRSRSTLLKSLGMVGMDAEPAARALEDTVAKMRQKLMKDHLQKGDKSA